ncbi:hypothetical protein NLI96_g6079 [Meripilus lineatus]|uniref:Transcription initiation factor TFIID subunit 4 n=1 Tax=Meripilus lineatus TaxID=2056292 RepID=A0AAD5V3I9_9APHY|nr:hypothetical protein NLI96_g6079 [Physisporinus lineatus]
MSKQKIELDGTQQVAPATTFSAAQWGTSNPALQPQTQQPTTTTPYAHYASYQHYPQASYSHYQYPPQQPAASQPSQTPTTVAVTTVAPKQPAQATTMDTTDVATLNDALGSAGVDLRAEEEGLHRSFDQYQSYRPYEDRSRKQPLSPNFDLRYLGPIIREIGTKHKVTNVPEDSVNYVALALRARLQDLVTAMIAASAHRTDTQYDRPSALYEDETPMWNLRVRNDVAKQLAAIEKVEREEEMKVRRERKERAEMAAAHAANLAAQASGGGTPMAVDGPTASSGGGEDGGDGGAPKKKKKKDGPGVTARNMSEDVRKKMSNAVASQAAGLGTGKYAWMNAANAATPSKPKPSTPAASSPAPGGLTPATTTAPAISATASNGGWARPYVSSKAAKQTTPPKEDDNRRLVTLRDAMFVIENERGHGGGRGSARGWS